MKKIIIVLLLIAAVSSCKKEKENQFSTWYVNGQKFTTNDVGVAKGKAIYVLSSDNYQMGSNGFSLAISGDGILPVNYLNCMHYVCLKIKYNSKFYFGRPPATISSSFNNDKHSFKLNKTWFYSSSNPDEDSILVKGVYLMNLKI